MLLSALLPHITVPYYCVSISLVAVGCKPGARHWASDTAQFSRNRKLKRSPSRQRSLVGKMSGIGWQTLSLSLGLVLSILNKVAPQACPAQCSCSGSTVDCHGLALRSVPRNIPRNTERL